MTVVEKRPEALQEMLSRLVRKHQVPGAQLAVHHDRETVAVEVGELEHRTGRAVTSAAAFPAGSVTKAFSASLAMILVADGDLELDAPVGEYLPELADLDDELTVGRVLSHTSGLASDTDSDDVSTSSLRRYVQAGCRPDSVIHPPGTGFSYSNMGYAVVGRLIETITGMTWWNAMGSILLRPLGIDPAFVGARPTAPRRAVATGHSVNTAVGRTRPVQQSVAPAEAPAGGLAVSAADLVRLGMLHVAPGVPALLPAADAAQMRKAETCAEPFGLADGWGLGLAVFRHGPAEWVGHDGNGDGTACYFRVNPKDGWVIALTTNSNTGYGLWLELVDEFGRAGIPVGRHQPHLSTQAVPAPPACLGTYVNGDIEYVVSAGEDGRLRVSADGDVITGITCHDDLSFALPDPMAAHQVVAGRFLRDRFSGRVTGLQIGGRLARRRTVPGRTGRRMTA